MDFPYGLAGKKSTCSAGDLGSIPGLGRFGEGKSYPLQCSGLEDSMDCILMASQRVRKDCETFSSLPAHSYFKICNSLHLLIMPRVWMILYILHIVLGGFIEKYMTRFRFKKLLLCELCYFFFSNKRSYFEYKRTIILKIIMICSEFFSQWL